MSGEVPASSSWINPPYDESKIEMIEQKADTHTHTHLRVTHKAAGGAEIVILGLEKHCQQRKEALFPHGPSSDRLT